MYRFRDIMINTSGNSITRCCAPNYDIKPLFIGYCDTTALEEQIKFHMFCNFKLLLLEIAKYMERNQRIH